MSLFWIAIILGIVEGLTEFLPVSSTGHLIIASSLLDFEGERSETFIVIMQLGAILAIVWEFRSRLTRVAMELPQRPEARRFVRNLVLGFLPAAVLGLLFYDFISKYLFSTLTVSLALIVGGIAILIIESLPISARVHSSESMGWGQALSIGFAQCLAMCPGVSRSAATILGGMGAGLDRRTATEFSFFLAIPTMFGASTMSLIKNHEYLQPGDVSSLSVAFLVSFLVGWASVKWLLHFVAGHTFRVFGWYRIIVGVIFWVMFRG